MRKEGLPIETSLQMNLSQHLSMTVQLQQAIQILQFSAQELRAAIEKEYLENPVLEMDYRDETMQPSPDIPQDVSISALSDYLGGDGKQPGYFVDDKEKSFEAAAPQCTTLEDELLEQVNFTFQDEMERAIATFIVGSISGQGYLTVPVAEIARATQSNIALVEKVLARVQEFDPAGVGARDLAECLRLQAKRQGIYEGLVAAIIDRHLDEVAAARIKEIAAAEHCRPADVQMGIDIVRRLDPKPGSAYGEGDSVTITPDVVVCKAEDGSYKVEIEDKYVPHLQISALYRQADQFDDSTRKYIAKRLNAAAWLINSIEQRRQTICHVVEEIVRRQQDYIEKGREYLHPMTMKEVADAIGVHESTVSRAVANKYVEMPGGIAALRSFFTARLPGNGSEDFAANQAKAAIDKLIKGEDPKKPLSDQKICTMLKEQGLDLSRRTVMKYREQLGYASSVKRKRY